METKRLLLVGGGGHCRSVLDCIRRLNRYDAFGIVEREGGEGLSSVPVVGTDADLPALYEAGWREAVVTLGSIGNSERRRALYDLLKKTGFTLPVIADPSAVISADARIEEGVFIGKLAVVNAGTHIGRCAIINTGAIIEHECEIGGFAHISPGAILCGSVTVEENTHIGAGTVIRQRMRIGGNTLIGIGSTVVKDIAAQAEAFGSPCRVVRLLCDVTNKSFSEESHFTPRYGNIRIFLPCRCYSFIQFPSFFGMADTAA